MTERAHAVRPVVKVLGAMRKLPAALKGVPLGELASEARLRGYWV